MTYGTCNDRILLDQLILILSFDNEFLPIHYQMVWFVRLVGVGRLVHCPLWIFYDNNDDDNNDDDNSDDDNSDDVNNDDDNNDDDNNDDYNDYDNDDDNDDDDA